MSQNTTTWLETGRQQLQQGNNAEALQCFERAIALDPSNADALNGRGAALKKLNRFQEALESYDRALTLNPQSYKIWFNKGLLLEQLGQDSGAIACYKKVLEINPDVREAGDRLYDLSRKTLLIRNTDQCPFSVSISNAPQQSAGSQNLPENFTDAQSWSSYGAYLNNSGKYHEAIAAANRALQIDLQLTHAWYVKGYALSRLEKQEEAIAHFDQALLLENDPALWFERGSSLGNLGRYEEAIVSYDKALEIKSDDDGAWYSRGFLLAYLGNYEEAIASLNRVLEIRPDYHSAWNERGNLLSHLKRYEEAIASYDKALEIKPDYQGVWYNRGGSLSHLKRYEEAISSYDKALEIKPTNYEAWNNRGISLDGLGCYEEAIASYDKALEIKPDLCQAWQNRGNSLSHLKRYEEAIASYDKVLAIEHDYWGAWFGRGGSVGDSNQCKNSVSSFLSMDLQNPDLDQRGYLGELACYQEGLKHVLQERQPEGWGRLHLAIGQAHFFYRRFSPAASRYCEKAIESYQTALQSLTVEAFPERHLEVLQNLVRAYLGLGDPYAARAAQIQAVQVLQKLLNRASSSQKRVLEQEFSIFRRVTVDVLVQSGEWALALREAERDKNRSLNWILEEWQEPQWSPTVEEMRGLLGETTAAVYWHLSNDALTTFVLRADAGEPIPVSVETSRCWKRDFENWVKDWNRDYEDYRTKGKQEEQYLQNHPWRVGLTERLERLRSILQIEAITPHLTHLTHLILVPHRDLHRFPLHALFDDRFTVTYLPSLQIGLSLQERYGREGLRVQRSDYPFGELRSKRLLSIENPPHEKTRELPYAELESAIVSSLFQQPTRLIREDVTEAALKENLASAHQLLHFTGHGDFNSRQPQLSALGLAGKERLTAEAIAQLPLENYQMVCLASCETATVGIQMLETEYVGLVSAFLRAKVAYVVSSL